MDIRKWPMSRIMQLPDCAFGRRWPIGIKRTIPGNQTQYHIIRQDLPDKLLLWAFNVNVKTATNTGGIVVGVRLASSAAATDEEFQRGERIFKAIEPESLNYDTRVGSGSALAWTNLKMIIETANQQISLRLQEQDNISTRVTVVFTVSTIPKEVPDWMCSGPASSL